MREIRLALLEADVNLEVARDFTNTNRAGQELASVGPSRARS